MYTNQRFSNISTQVISHGDLQITFGKYYLLRSLYKVKLINVFVTVLNRIKSL